MAHRTAALVLIAGLFIFPASAWAHSGGLDSKGCHTNKKTGEYHCHRAQPSGGEKAKSSAPDAAPVVKKSTTGICHDRDSPYYSRTTNYTAFATMAACLDSGGRRPK